MTKYLSYCDHCIHEWKWFIDEPCKNCIWEFLNPNNTEPKPKHFEEKKNGI